MITENTTCKQVEEKRNDRKDFKSMSVTRKEITRGGKSYKVEKLEAHGLDLKRCLL